MDTEKRRSVAVITGAPLWFKHASNIDIEIKKNLDMLSFHVSPFYSVSNKIKKDSSLILQTQLNEYF